MRSLKIDNYEINDDSDCYVIAEIGHNHQGSIEKCKEMFLRAKQSGAHAVKLQKRHNVSLFTKDFYSSAYNSENSFGATYGEHRDALEFAHEEYSHLIEYAREIGITFFATAFDFESADFLEKLDMPAFKVASGDIINIPLLKHIAQIDKPMLISTGGANMDDIQRAYDTIMPINRQLCIMQCTAEYPVKAKDMNLRVIESFRKVFPDIIIGSSDHQSGISMALMGYVLGARVIEKHFTLNRAAKGTDHAFSLEQLGLSKMIRELRRARLAFGDGVKHRRKCEEKALYKIGKKLVASRDLPVGHVLIYEDLAIKSPNDGLPPYELENVIGLTLISELEQDQNIEFKNLSDC